MGIAIASRLGTHNCKKNIGIMIAVQLENVSRIYRTDKIETIALERINLTVDTGEFISIMGPSGCGKTTMLRLIAGFEKPTSGEIYIGDRPVSGKDNFVSPEKREIGMVFQSYAVWPHMNVYDNIAYPLKIKKTDKKEIEERVNQALKTVHLEQYKDRFPSELSGGQQQRVAIARALVSEAPIILADEPTGNLDSATAEEIIEILKKLAKERNKCVIVVTHSKEVANAADIILELSDKKLKKVDSLI